MLFPRDTDINSGSDKAAGGRNNAQVLWEQDEDEILFSMVHNDVDIYSLGSIQTETINTEPIVWRMVLQNELKFNHSQSFEYI